MQLACPNCDAKYEVPDDAIPASGRDVQCSACGHGWFQQPLNLFPEASGGTGSPVLPPATAGEKTAPAEAENEPWPEEDSPEITAVTTADSDPAAAQPAVVQSTEAALSELLASDTGYFASGEEADEEIPAPRPAAAAPAAPAVPPPPRRDLEEGVLAILREEAELEAEARRLEAQRAANRRLVAETAMQVQPDLGVDQAPVAAPVLSAAQKRLAMLRGEDLDEGESASDRPVIARRDLLPDVEEINSTLQPEDIAAADAEVDALPDLTRSRSFRSGFLLAIAVLILASALYISAGSLAEMLPQFRPQIEQYVGFIDGLRTWLNGLMDAATHKILPDGAPQG